ncbi:hypothetical protein ACLOJK_036475 [Asimina triloba]
MAHLNSFDPTIDHHRDDPELFLPEPIWAFVLLKLSTSVVAAGRCLNRMIQATHFISDASSTPLPSTVIRPRPLPSACHPHAVRLHRRPLASPPAHDRCRPYVAHTTSARCTTISASSFSSKSASWQRRHRRGMITIAPHRRPTFALMKPPLCDTHGLKMKIMLSE